MLYFITNKMVSEAANLQEHVPNIQASRLDTQGGRGSASDIGIKGLDGAIFT